MRPKGPAEALARRRRAMALIGQGMKLAGCSCSGHVAGLLRGVLAGRLGLDASDTGDRPDRRLGAVLVKIEETLKPVRARIKRNAWHPCGTMWRGGAT